jgi:hypothetical protein
MYEVLSGLTSGDTVAISGVFLIAAEARISTAAKYWDNSPEGAAGSEVTPSTEPASPLAPTPSMSVVPTPDRAPSPPMPQLPKAARSAAQAAPALVYSCPMHPEVRSNGPGKCPKCGMNLEPIPDGGK